MDFPKRAATFAHCQHAAQFAVSINAVKFWVALINFGGTWQIMDTQKNNQVAS
jgi:hypothetical protein